MFLLVFLDCVFIASKFTVNRSGTLFAQTYVLWIHFSSVCQLLYLESSATAHFLQWKVHSCHNLLLRRLLIISQIIRASISTATHRAWLGIYSQNCHTMVNGPTFVFANASVCGWSIHKQLPTVHLHKNKIPFLKRLSFKTTRNINVPHFHVCFLVGGSKKGGNIKGLVRKGVTLIA